MVPAGKVTPKSPSVKTKQEISCGVLQVLYSSNHSDVFGVHPPSQAPAAFTMTSFITIHWAFAESDKIISTISEPIFFPKLFLIDKYCKGESTPC